jgi:CheY-like chemotaxis protein
LFRTIARAHRALVDDEPLARMTTADMVRSKGFRVVEASTAAEALNLVGERSVAAVVTDIRMPGMNGLELSRHVRRIQPEMPLVFVSGEATPAAGAPHRHVPSIAAG